MIAVQPGARDRSPIRYDVVFLEALMDVLSLLQWPAMVITLIAAWLVASQSKVRRNWGFWTFIVSNVLWIVWGWHEGAIALIVLQVGLFVLNLRGAKKNDPAAA